MVVAHRRIGSQGFVGRERLQQIVALPHAATSETVPSIIARLLHRFCSLGVGLDIPQHLKQVNVVLNDRAFEPPGSLLRAQKPVADYCRD